MPRRNRHIRAFQLNPWQHTCTWLQRSIYSTSPGFQQGLRRALSRIVCLISTLLDTEDSVTLEGDIVWLWLPIPRLLPLADGFTYEHVGSVWPASEQGVIPILDKTVSLKVHQLRGAVDDGGTAAALMTLSTLVIQGMSGKPPSQFGHVETSDRLSGDLTVVEAAVSLRRITGKAYTFPDGLSLSLDVAVWAAGDLQRACGLATGTPTRPLSVGQLPLVVPYAVGTVDNGYQMATHGLFETLQSNIKGVAQVLPDDLPAEEDVDAAHQVVHNGPFSAYMALRDEAAWLAHAEDEPRLAIVTAASAAEVLANAVLIGMLVDELPLRKLSTS